MPQIILQITKSILMSLRRCWAIMQCAPHTFLHRTCPLNGPLRIPVGAGEPRWLVALHAAKVHFESRVHAMKSSVTLFNQPIRIGEDGDDLPHWYNGKPVVKAMNRLPPPAKQADQRVLAARLGETTNSVVLLRARCTQVEHMAGSLLLTIMRLG